MCHVLHRCHVRCVEKDDLVRRYFAVVIPSSIIDPSIETSPAVPRANGRPGLTAMDSTTTNDIQSMRDTSPLDVGTESSDQPMGMADGMDIDQSASSGDSGSPPAQAIEVPPEPELGDETTSYVAVRLPNGSRLSRRYVPGFVRVLVDGRARQWQSEDGHDCANMWGCSRMGVAVGDNRQEGADGNRTRVW